MAAGTDIDTSAYLPLPRSDLQATVALGSELITRIPKPAEPRVRTAAKRMRTSLSALQAAWKERDRTQTVVSDVDVRGADVLLDRAWSGCSARLEALAAFVEHGVPGAQEAHTLHASLFPNLAFLKLPYRSEWAESEKLLGRIEDEGLAERLEALAGPGILAAIQHAHEAYGKALGITSARDVASAVLVAEPLRAAQRAIAYYVMQVVALYDPEDPSTAEVVVKALEPIPSMRERARRGTSSGRVTAETPLPEEPADESVQSASG